MFDKIASVYFIWKICRYFFCTGNGQPREPALCQLYRHTFVRCSYRHMSTVGGSRLRSSEPPNTWSVPRRARARSVLRRRSRSTVSEENRRCVQSSSTGSYSTKHRSHTWPLSVKTGIKRKKVSTIYDTIRDAILTCARKPTRVSLIYRTDD